jgi:hypothetical protein
MSYCMLLNSLRINITIIITVTIIISCRLCLFSAIMCCTLCSYVYLHRVVSVIGLVAVGSAHK